MEDACAARALVKRLHPRALAVGVLLSGCAAGPSAPPASAPPTTASVVAPRRAELDGPALFATTCLGCHDEPNLARPNFDAPMTRTTATIALRAIFERAMPPPRSSERASLDPRTRATLTSWLCRETGRDTAACAELLVDEDAPTLTRSGPTILEAMKQAGAPPLPETRTELLLSVSPPGSTQTVREGSVVAGVLLTALEACKSGRTGATTSQSGATSPSSTGTSASATPLAGAQPPPTNVNACVQLLFEAGIVPPAPYAR